MWLQAMKNYIGYCSCDGFLICQCALFISISISSPPMSAHSPAQPYSANYPTIRVVFSRWHSNLSRKPKITGFSIQVPNICQRTIRITSQDKDELKKGSDFEKLLWRVKFIRSIQILSAKSGRTCSIVETKGRSA